MIDGAMELTTSGTTSESTSTESYDSDAASFCEYMDNYDAIVEAGGDGVPCHECDNPGAMHFEPVTFRVFCDDGCLDAYIALYGLSGKSGSSSSSSSSSSRSKGGKKKKSSGSRSKKKKSGGGKGNGSGQKKKSSGRTVSSGGGGGGGKGKKTTTRNIPSSGHNKNVRKSTSVAKSNLGVLKEKLKQKNRDKAAGADDQRNTTDVSM